MFKRDLPFKIGRNKFLNLSVRSIAAYFYYSIRQFQERKHAFDEELEFDWTENNFSRTALLNLLIASHPKKSAAEYLEIGCASDLNFNAIMSRHKVGVDPDQGGTHRMTSDEFFSQNTKEFDVIFIDGLHTFAQVKKDFINAVKCLSDSGIIVLDDMIPRNWKEHQTPRVQTQWNGDVWKLLFSLEQWSWLDYRVVQIDSGQCVVFVNDTFTVSFDSDETAFAEAEFKYFYDNFSSLKTVSLADGLIWIEEKLSS